MRRETVREVFPDLGKIYTGYTKMLHFLCVERPYGNKQQLPQDKETRGNSARMPQRFGLS